MSTERIIPRRPAILAVLLGIATALMLVGSLLWVVWFAFPVSAAGVALLVGNAANLRLLKLGVAMEEANLVLTTFWSSRSVALVRVISVARAPDNDWIEVAVRGEPPLAIRVWSRERDRLICEIEQRIEQRRTELSN